MPRIKTPKEKAEFYINKSIYDKAEKFCNIKRDNIELSEKDLNCIREFFEWYFINEKENKKILKLENSIRLIPAIIYYNKEYDNLIDVLIKAKKCGTSVTLKKFEILYGKENGKIKFDEYRNKQAVTNTFEYKQKEYGWTKEQFDEYNSSRAVTKKNLIKRHGKKEGIKIWNEYREKQRKTTTKEYFIETYGLKEGTKKFNNFSMKRNNQGLINLNSFDKMRCNHKSIYSKLSQDLFKCLDVILKTHKIEEVYYGENEKNLKLWKYGTGYLLDFYVPKLNKIIEFNGDFFHANPEIYDEDDLIKIVNETMKVKDIWNKERIRTFRVEEHFKTKIKIVWEKDFRENKDKIIEDCVKFLFDGE